MMPNYVVKVKASIPVEIVIDVRGISEADAKRRAAMACQWHPQKWRTILDPDLVDPETVTVVSVNR
jgi:hypothetical protein